jgi:hypothetical protein
MDIFSYLKEQEKIKEIDEEEVGVTDKKNIVALDDITIDKLTDEQDLKFKKTLKDLDLSTSTNLNKALQDQAKNLSEVYKDTNKSSSLLDLAGSVVAGVGALGIVRSGGKAVARIARAAKTKIAAAAAKITGKKIAATATKTAASAATKAITSAATKTVTKTAASTAVKSGAKALGKSALKKIPLVGLAAGIGFGASRLLKGDITGAGLEVLSGAASTVPGAGTAASIGIDAALAAKDINKEIKKESQEEQKTNKNYLTQEKEILEKKSKDFYLQQEKQDFKEKNIIEQPKQNTSTNIKEIFNKEISSSAAQIQPFDPIINILTPAFASMNNNMEYIKALLSNIERKIGNVSNTETEEPPLIVNPPPVIPPDISSNNIPKSFMSKPGGSIKAYRSEINDTFNAQTRGVIVV